MDNYKHDNWALQIIPVLGGFINVHDILSLRDADKHRYIVSDVQRVVDNSDKQRFTLRNEPHLQICANQGHSILVMHLSIFDL